MEKILEIVNLQKRFELHILNEKQIEALRQVSFDVHEGEVVALTGKSGSGKSSLMKCLYRTYLASCGKILYRTAHGKTIDLATAPDYEVLQIRKSEMTYCSQFLQVIPRVTAMNVVAAGLVARGSSMADAQLATSECFERLSLPFDLWDAYPSTFSGGEQQRVNIARAMISRPRILLVDEPTASLDLKTKDAVIEMLLDLKRQGTTIILITHDEHTLNKMADRSLHLESGLIKEVVYA
jgi:alpha-D-ribose 1-methylphosphonate 5-triphosphate synthase subunit PhnL